MKLFYPVVIFSLTLCVCLTTGAEEKKQEGRRIFGIRPFGPFMRVLGMMGLPILPILLLRQLLVGAGAANQQGAGAGAGMGSLGALGLLGPFGAGAGLGGLRPGGAAGGGLAGLFGGGAGGAGAAGAGNSGATALFLQKRSAADKLQPLLGALARLERAVDQYDLGAPDCQRRIVCELHRKTIKPSVGSLTEKLIQAFG